MVTMKQLELLSLDPELDVAELVLLLEVGTDVGLGVEYGAFCLSQLKPKIEVWASIYLQHMLLLETSNTSKLY